MSFIFLFLIFVSPAIATGPIPAKCPPEMHWVRAHFRRAYIRSDGALVSAANVVAHCQDNPPSYAIWAARLKTGRPPGWLLIREKGRPWSEDEKERVLEALSTLPNELLLTSVDGIYRFKTSALYVLNPASGNGDQIALYDLAFAKGQNLARIIAHEFAHKLYRKMTAEQARSYNKAAEWIPAKNGRNENILVPGRQEYVEDDGASGADEDFSNNIEYFLFNPQSLKTQSPRVFNWIRDQFGDKFKRAGARH